ncbi:hypothetical protein [Thiomonas sp.]
MSILQNSMLRSFACPFEGGVQIGVKSVDLRDEIVQGAQRLKESNRATQINSRTREPRLAHVVRLSWVKEIK